MEIIHYTRRGTLLSTSTPSNATSTGVLVGVKGQDGCGKYHLCYNSVEYAGINSSISIYSPIVIDTCNDDSETTNKKT